jgi:hypothetical protein
VGVGVSGVGLHRRHCNWFVYDERQGFYIQITWCLRLPTCCRNYTIIELIVHSSKKPSLRTNSLRLFPNPTGLPKFSLP